MASLLTRIQYNVSFSAGYLGEYEWMKAIQAVLDNTATFAFMLKISEGPYWTGLPVKMG